MAGARPRGFRTRLLELVGTISLAAGAVGVFLPVIPTTPFVILAAFCFSSNPRVYGWLEHSPFFGDYIRGWREHRTIPTRARVQGIVMVWTALILTMAFLMTEEWHRIMLTVVGLCVTVHLLTVFRGKRE